MAKLLFNKTKKADDIRFRKRLRAAYVSGLALSILANLAMAVYIWQM